MEKNNLKIRELTLKNGLSFPSDEELIMLILGSGTKGYPIEKLAKKILSVVMASNPDELIENLVKINGVGTNKALAIAAALEFGRRLTRSPQAVISQAKDIVPYIQNYAMQPQEHFICVSLNGAREIISIRVVCVGNGNMAVLHPSEIFNEAIKERASAIIISHNHPGGTLAPSVEDIKTTQSIVEASHYIGIALLDHIIITKNGYFSFSEHDLLN